MLRQYRKIFSSLILAYIEAAAILEQGEIGYSSVGLPGAVDLGPGLDETSRTSGGTSMGRALINGAQSLVKVLSLHSRI